MPKGLKRAIGALLAVFAIYSLLGFLILPGVALRVINQQLANYATVPAKLERLELNPYNLKVTLWGLSIGAPGKEQIGFERLFADLEIDSLWTKALHLKAVELDKPKTELLFSKDGTLNLAGLFKLPPIEPAKPDEPPSKPFPLRIDEIKLADGYVHFQDLRPSEPIEFLYDALNFELKNLSTLPEDNADMTLVAAGPNGGQIDWVGRISLVPITSEGTLKVTDGKMKLWWPYVRDALPLALKDGVLSLETHYKLSLAKETELLLDKTSIKVAPFAIDAPDGRPLVRLKTLEVSETSIDLAKQLVTVGKIRSQGLETWAARESDGQLDWQKLFASQPSKNEQKKVEAEKKQPATASGSETTAAAPAAPSKPWQVLLRDTQLRDYRIHLADKVPKEPVALEVGPLNLDLNNFDSLNKSPFTLKLDTGLGKQGKLTAAGEVNLAPVRAKLDVTTRDIDLRIAQSYVTPFIRLEVRSGMLNSDLAVDLKSTEPLALGITGKAQVDQLHTLDTLKSRDFVKWQRVNVDGINFQLGNSLSIASVNLDQPYARFIIAEDRTTNINDLLVAQPEDGGKAAGSKPADSKPAAKSKPAAASGDKPMAIRIGEINIRNGSANFADNSLTPNFATAIQQLNGQIGTIDNQQNKPAPVNINGKVDRYAPVTIKGSLNPFDPLASLDIATSFKRVELTTLTPYSGKFAGYRIRKGRLNLDLHYLITKGQLKAENKVVVEQLQLGEKVDSPDAVNLPLKLAIALLKDVDGKISIELPVSGDLNNPQFSVMPIVWQTLRNLIVKAAAAPFKLIGGLLNGSGAEDLGTVSFSPGSDELSPEAQGSLDKLAEALKKRPGLRLEIEGTSAEASDGPLIAQQRLEREYQSTYYKILQRRGDKVPAQASDLMVPDDEKGPMLDGIYRTRLKQQPPPEWVDLGKEERQNQLRQAVLKSWSSSALLLRQLGQSRASSIKDYLVDKGQLEDDRVYFVDATIGQPEKDGRVISPLHLDSE
ncbi:DUF748 domain-containing protein [Pseudomonas sp. NPDC090202]|uniref:DUF748 domain-containing protein n=1 Tax=unclassified Pseudomonas TaxID=196821 RepID=UPI00381B1E04